MFWRAIPATIALLAALACTTVESNNAYRRGSQAFEAGDYTRAISDLQEAAELNPTSFRTQNLLASAYFEAGEVKEGWPHVRHAVNLKPDNEDGRQNFNRYFAAMREETNLSTGDTSQQVLDKLGRPDDIIEEDFEIWWRYGRLGLSFKAGYLTRATAMDYE